MLRTFCVDGNRVFASIVLKIDSKLHMCIRNFGENLELYLYLIVFYGFSDATVFRGWGLRHAQDVSTQSYQPPGDTAAKRLER